MSEEDEEATFVEPSKRGKLTFEIIGNLTGITEDCVVLHFNVFKGWRSAGYGRFYIRSCYNGMAW